MATILPFMGIRPHKEYVRKIASPPYDVVSSKEARILAQNNPMSYLHISRPEIDLPSDIDEHDVQVYIKGKENYHMFKAKGWLKKDDKKCFYFYKQHMGNHTQIGIVCVASCDDYDNDIIKKHELTRQDKEDDRTKHIDTIGANTEPVFFTYKANNQIDALISNYIQLAPFEYEFQSDDGVIHTFWVCSDNTLIDQLIRLFADIQYLYVADGHHRSAAASRVRKIRQKNNPYHKGNEEYNYFLTVCFPDNQMNIMPYNRVVKDLNGLSKQEFLIKIKEKFDVCESDISLPVAPHQFCMYLDGQWFLLTAKSNIITADPVKSLDVSILQDNILYPLLSIVDPRKDKRINFIGGIKGTQELKRVVDSKEYAVAFSLYPISVKQIMDIADSGNILPPKSTWFEPKLKSGLFVHELE